jgi:ADP-heptose:LPS heptosyltransferase
VPAAADAGRRRSDRNQKLKHRQLIIRPGAIGDCITSLPAMEFLRSDYTEVWVPSPNVPLIRFADRVRALSAIGIDLVGITEPALAAFSDFDSIVSWYGSNRDDFRAAVAHLPFTFFPALPDGSCHAADFYMRQVGGPDGARPRLECPRGNSSFIAIQPFSGSAKKNWPLERFRALASELPLPARFCAGPEEPLDGAVKIDDLYELACWLATARAFIGNDSGITHLAAAAGTPAVVLFGPTDPAVWAPRNAAVVKGDSMEAISVSQVAREVRDLLQREDTRRR